MFTVDSPLQGGVAVFVFGVDVVAVEILVG